MFCSFDCPTTFIGIKEVQRAFARGHGGSRAGLYKRKVCDGSGTPRLLPLDARLSPLDPGSERGEGREREREVTLLPSFSTPDKSEGEGGPVLYPSPRVLTPSHTSLGPTPRAVDSPPSWPAFPPPSAPCNRSRAWWEPKESSKKGGIPPSPPLLRILLGHSAPHPPHFLIFQPRGSLRCSPNSYHLLYFFRMDLPTGK